MNYRKKPVGVEDDECCSRRCRGPMTWWRKEGMGFMNLGFTGIEWVGGDEIWEQRDCREADCMLEQVWAHSHGLAS